MSSSLQIVILQSPIKTEMGIYTYGLEQLYIMENKIGTPF